MRPRVWAAAAAMAAIVLTIYVPDIGHGFISDDFRWIVESRSESLADLVGLFGQDVGFYRPLVAVTFAADYALWGAQALGYGVTNLALLTMAAVLLFVLARDVRLPPAAALLAAGVWLLNFHAVNMALLWISGRTAMLACVFSLITAIFVIRRRPLLAGVACLAAMLSKEEAIALPPLFAAYTWLSTGRSAVPGATWTLWAAALAYLVLRLSSDAFWPHDAPAFYAFTFSPALIARNVLEYADRAGTLALGASLVLLATARVGRHDFDERERGVLLFAALWIPAMFALTVLVPVRSSLYALLPSIGTALIAGAIGSAASRLRPPAFAKTAIVLLVAAAMLVPVYRSRNVRWVAIAELSERILRTLERETAGRAGGHILLVDDRGERLNLDAAFGSLFPQAVRLRLGEGWTGEIVARPEEAQRQGDLAFVLSDGALVLRDSTPP